MGRLTQICLSMRVILFLLTNFLFPSSLSAGAPYPLTCFLSGTSYPESSLISFSLESPSPQACQAECRQAGEPCSAWTWTDSSFSIFPDACVLYNSTEGPLECQHCVSGPPLCLCSYQGQCQVEEDNFLGVEQNVDETECQQICSENDQCEFYSWFSDSSPLSHLCMLFSSCSDTDLLCYGCFTGPSECPDLMPTSTGGPTTPMTTTVSPTTTSTTTTTTTPETVCSHDGQCRVTETNLVSTIANVTVEMDCKHFCAQNEECLVYTWFGDLNPLSFLCMLFSSCDSEDTLCYDCFTGPQAC